MIDHKDDSGQVLLTSAILFAIIIIIISLMLNNIIYATNVAYIGFIDGSKYEDLSIRQLTTSEAANSYQYSPDEIILTQYMSDYKKAINYLTNSKGRYVDLTNTYYTDPFLGLTVTQTKWDLVITNKDSTVKYAIYTGSIDPTAPSPPANPSEPTAKFSSASYTVNEGGTCTVTVELDHVYDDDVTINYKTTGDTALPGTNYINVPSGSLIIPSGELSGTFSITTKYIGGYTGVTLAFTVDFNGVTNAVEGSPTSTTISITDTDPAPTSTPVPVAHAMTVDCTAVRQPNPNQKDVKITTVVKNTGTNPLTNVLLSLVSPTGKPFAPGGSPLSVGTTPQSIGNMNPGDTRTIVWVIKTQNQNDFVNVQVKAVSDELTAGVNSQLWMNI